MIIEEFKVNYLLLDAARVEGYMSHALSLNADHRCLYQGGNEEGLEGVAPYLFKLEPQTDFSNWYFNEGWENSWGIPLFSETSFDELFRHFRKFLTVKTEDGKQLYFRFYDPRVLRLFLPTCDPGQLKTFFGPISFFLLEPEINGSASHFKYFNTELVVENVNQESLDAFFIKPEPAIPLAAATPSAEGYKPEIFLSPEGDIAQFQTFLEQCQEEELTRFFEGNVLYYFKTENASYHRYFCMKTPGKLSYGEISVEELERMMHEKAEQEKSEKAAMEQEMEAQQQKNKGFWRIFGK